MFKRLKERFAQAKTLAKNKKGVSQFVEMLIIVMVTLAVGAVVIGVIWDKVDQAQDYSGEQGNEDDLVNGGAGA